MPQKKGYGPFSTLLSAAALWFVIVGVFAVRPSVALAAAQRPPQPSARADRPTFTRDIAPLVFSQCSTCHRPGGSAPFSLLTYDDVATRAAQIAAAVKGRVMPPWKPEPGYGEFQGERRLTDEQIATVVRWVDQGAIEGDAALLPPVPRSAAQWPLGPPDLIITMPEPYTVPGSGPDLFRNFVIPIPTSGTRYVRAWEFQPGNPAVVHHATMHLDSSRSSRQLDEQDPEPGYEGLMPFSVKDPDGYFLGWTPGQQPYAAGPETAWTLNENSDLIVMMHLRPSGRPEGIRASLGLYFSPAPPSQVPAMLRLGRQDIDIPAGDAHYTITDSYTLPVDVDVHTVYPHAHYRATEIKGFATLPDGAKRWLLYIRKWDFNWQDVYRYATPIFLPAGTTVAMEYTYDNSAENPHNPYRPPSRVTFGAKSSDEMGDLWLQLVPRKQADLAVLSREFAERLLPTTISGFEMMLAADPDDRGLHDNVALLYERTGNLERAASHFSESLRINPDSATAHYNVGSTLLKQGEWAQGREHLQQALKLRPDYPDAHNNLGVAFQQERRLEDAAVHYRESIRLEPMDASAHYNLGVVMQAQGQVDEAVQRYREALRLRADYASAHHLLAVALQSQGKTGEAVQEYRQAVRLTPDAPLPLIELAWILATSPDAGTRRPGEAVVLARRAALVTAPAPPEVLDVLAASLAALGEFEQAVTAGEAALASAEAGDKDAGALRARLELYRQKKAYLAPR